MQQGIQKSSKYGMGIYFYAEPLNYLIPHIAVEGFEVNVLGNEGYTFIVEDSWYCCCCDDYCTSDSVAAD